MPIAIARRPSMSGRNRWGDMASDAPTGRRRASSLEGWNAPHPGRARSARPSARPPRRARTSRPCGSRRPRAAGAAARPRSGRRSRGPARPRPRSRRAGRRRRARSPPRGPVGHAKLTTGRPLLIASSSASGRPSARELSAKIDARSSSRSTWATRPARQTCASNPSSAISARSARRSPPLPQIRSRHSGCSAATAANARIRRSKPLTGWSRPTARTTGRASGERSPGSAGTAFGITCTGVGHR